LADGIADIIDSYVAFVKADYAKTFKNKFENARDTYIKSLNTFASFKNDAHYIPVGCIDENGDALYVTINGAQVKACVRQDGRWVVREGDPAEYTITSTVVTGVTVNSASVKVKETQTGTVVFTLDNTVTVTGETGLTEVGFEIDDVVYTIGSSTVENVTVAYDETARTITITFANVAANHKVEFAPVASN
jgi:hypothetical protein